MQDSGLIEIFPLICILNTRASLNPLRVYHWGTAVTDGLRVAILFVY